MKSDIIFDCEEFIIISEDWKGTRVIQVGFWEEGRCPWFADLIKIIEMVEKHFPQHYHKLMRALETRSDHDVFDIRTMACESCGNVHEVLFYHGIKKWLCEECGQLALKGGELSV